MVRKRWLMLMVTEYHSGVWKQLGQNPSPAVNKSYRAILLSAETVPASLAAVGVERNVNNEPTLSTFFFLGGGEIKKATHITRNLFLLLLIIIYMIMFSPVSCE